MVKRLRRRHSRRGATTLWVLLLGMPWVLFAAVMAIDVTRTVAVQSQMKSVATASALASASQYQQNQALIEPMTAMQVGYETFDRGTTGQTRVTDVVVMYRNIQVSPDNSRVTVTAGYRLPNMLVLPALRAFVPNADGWLSETLVVEKTAFICVPGQAGPTDGFCQQPRA